MRGTAWLAAKVVVAGDGDGHNRDAADSATDDGADVYVRTAGVGSVVCIRISAWSTRWASRSSARRGRSKGARRGRGRISEWWDTFSGLDCE